MNSIASTTDCKDNFPYYFLTKKTNRYHSLGLGKLQEILYEDGKLKAVSHSDKFEGDRSIIIEAKAAIIYLLNSKTFHSLPSHIPPVFDSSYLIKGEDMQEVGGIIGTGGLYGTGQIEVPIDAVFSEKIEPLIDFQILMVPGGWVLLARH